MARSKSSKKVDPSELAFQDGLDLARRFPVCTSVLMRTNVYRRHGTKCPKEAYAVVTQSGNIYAHPSRRQEAEEWAYILAHCALHLAFGHHVEKPNPAAWEVACNVVVERFLLSLKFGDNPHAPVELPGGSEESLYRRFVEQGVPPELRGRGAGTGSLILDYPAIDSYRQPIDFARAFAHGLSHAVLEAVEVAGGVADDERTSRKAMTRPEKARRWFMTNYPLLGAMAAGFKVIEDPNLCRRLDIAVAAVDPRYAEIYFNPAAGMNMEECRFVMAHEMLHVGLRHQERCEGRDFFLWNASCDFVINGWLVEMGVGNIPAFGGLYDPELKNLSAEEIYDRLVRDIRRSRKLCTLRGFGVGDILGPSEGRDGTAIDLEDFCRRCLAQGLGLHKQGGRGLLPSGLVEEIEAMSAPPIPWEVQLAQWFDNYILPPERRRTYSRLSRRQSATPEIPRPATIPLQDSQMERTFGVVLDTSGSMDTKLLGYGLGAIASYAASREVPLVRVVFCDAVAYDAGYLAPDDIAGRVTVKGRGGTILQPGIDLLTRAEDFPKAGPILVITDADCDRVSVSREHAFLVPKHATLPFPPKGPVFRMQVEAT